MEHMKMSSNNTARTHTYSEEKPYAKVVAASLDESIPLSYGTSDSSSESGSKQQNQQLQMDIAMKQMGRDIGRGVRRSPSTTKATVKEVGGQLQASNRKDSMTNHHTRVLDNIISERMGQGHSVDFGRSHIGINEVNPDCVMSDESESTRSTNKGETLKIRMPVNRGVRRQSSEATGNTVLSMESDAQVKSVATTRRNTDLLMAKPRRDDSEAQMANKSKFRSESIYDSEMNPSTWREEALPTGKAMDMKRIYGPKLSDAKGFADTEIPSSEQYFAGGGKNDCLIDLSKDQGQYSKKGNDAAQQDLQYGKFDPEKSTGLAVAIAVEEEDEDMYVPAAIEYDPDAKPPIYKHRRFRLYSMLVSVVLVFFVVIGVTIGVMMSTKKGSESSDLIDNKENVEIRAVIEQVVGSSNLNDVNSPYARALEWITNEDSAQVLPSAANFVQRYIAAYVYFATSSEEKPWTSCGQAKVGESDDCTLIKFLSKDRLNVTVEIPWMRWLSNYTECKWAGLLCNENGQIRSIEIPGTMNTGSFPEGLKQFSYLQSINLGLGGLSGTLPPAINEMKHLISIELQSNAITGPIPLEWWNARSLQRINLSLNRLTGTLPKEIIGLKDVKGIYLYNNLLSGPIPSEIGEIKSLTYVRIQQNMFTGEFPFNAVKNAVEIFIGKNQFTGSIPSEIGEITALEGFRLNDNQFTGDLPSSIYNLTNLLRLDVSNCNLTGTLSSSIAQLSNLEILHINKNQFSGFVPTELGNLTKLEEVRLAGNNFFGSIPKELCSARENNEYFEFLEADCGVSDATSLPQVFCTDGCCTGCCDLTGTVCYGLEEE